MYIASDGSELLSVDKVMKDKLDMFMRLDKFDVPLREIGMIYNFSKTNIMASIAQLRIIAQEAIEHIADENLTLNNVIYEDGGFNIIFNYKGNKLSYSISED